MADEGYGSAPPTKSLWNICERLVGGTFARTKVGGAGVDAARKHFPLLITSAVQLLLGVDDNVAATCVVSIQATPRSKETK